MCKLRRVTEGAIADEGACESFALSGFNGDERDGGRSIFGNSLEGFGGFPVRAATLRKTSANGRRQMLERRVTLTTQMNNSILILYGTVTGNAELCARQAASRLDEMGFQTVVKDVLDVEAQQLENERTLLVRVSTHGDGNPPDSAAPPWEALARGGSFDFSKLRFSVLALGDSSYKLSCQCGKDFDAVLERQDARRLAPRVDCDVEWAAPGAAWIESVVTALTSQAVRSENPLCATR